jgi:hypothetical protein
VVITVSPNDNNGQGNGTTPFNRTYASNTVVSLTAPATAGGNTFQKWQQDGADWSVNAATIVTMGGLHTLTAIYTGAVASSTAYVTGTVLGTLRNNYGGYVGMKFVAGSGPITVTQLGRMMTSGNSGTHTVKLVNASDGTDVPGGAVSLALSGGTVGQFTYASLANPVTLAAGTAYYLVSQETSGADSWYDVNTTVTTTSAATESSGVYGTGSGTWYLYGSADQEYVPLDFKYSSPAPEALSASAASFALDRGAQVGPDAPTGANVTVIRDPVATNHLVFRLTGQPHKRYLIESSSDLLRWAPLGNTIVENGIIDLQDTNRSRSDRRFYRLSPSPAP